MIPGGGGGGASGQASSASQTSPFSDADWKGFLSATVLLASNLDRKLRDEICRSTEQDLVKFLTDQAVIKLENLRQSLAKEAMSVIELNLEANSILTSRKQAQTVAADIYLLVKAIGEKNKEGLAKIFKSGTEVEYLREEVVRLSGLVTGLSNTVDSLQKLVSTMVSMNASPPKKNVTKRPRTAANDSLVDDSMAFEEDDEANAEPTTSSKSYSKVAVSMTRQNNLPIKDYTKNARNSKSNEWQEVTSKKRSKPPALKCTGDISFGNGLKAVRPRFHFRVANLAANAEVPEIKEYLQSLGVQSSEVLALKSNSFSKSFHIIVFEESREIINNGNNWPRNAYISRYYLPRPAHLSPGSSVSKFASTQRTTQQPDVRHLTANNDMEIQSINGGGNTAAITSSQ